MPDSRQHSLSFRFLILPLFAALCSTSFVAANPLSESELRKAQSSNAGLSALDLNVAVSEKMAGFKKKSENDQFRPKVFEGRPVALDEVTRIEYDLSAGRRTLCSGVLVNDDTVLTAGHCSCGKKETYIVTVPTEPEDSIVSSSVERIVRFPFYNCTMPNLAQPGRDLALLKLSRKFENTKLSKFASPLDTVSEDDTARFLLAGYGRTTSGGFPNRLLGAFSPVLDRDCLNAQKRGVRCAPFREFILSALVSATYPGVDTCDGDSGGPVYWFAPDRDGSDTGLASRRLIGLTSRGLRGVPQFGPTGCGGGGIYTSMGFPDVIAWLVVNGVDVDFYVSKDQSEQVGIQ